MRVDDRGGLGYGVEHAVGYRLRVLAHDGIRAVEHQHALEAVLARPRVGGGDDKGRVILAGELLRRDVEEVIKARRVAVERGDVLHLARVGGDILVDNVAHGLKIYLLPLVVGVHPVRQRREEALLPQRVVRGKRVRHRNTVILAHALQCLHARRIAALGRFQHIDYRTVRIFQVYRTHERFKVYAEVILRVVIPVAEHRKVAVRRRVAVLDGQHIREEAVARPGEVFHRHAALVVRAGEIFILDIVLQKVLPHCPLARRAVAADDGVAHYQHFHVAPMGELLIKAVFLRFLGALCPLRLRAFCLLRTLLLGGLRRGCFFLGGSVGLRLRALRRGELPALKLRLPRLQNDHEHQCRN